MADTKNNYVGYNFGVFSDPTNQQNGVPTKYLNLQGLTDFWSKIKTYVDDQDGALFEATKDKIEDVDSTLRKYIESLTINGQEVTKTSEGENVVGTGLAVTLEGEDIKVRVDGTAAAAGEKYADGVYTVRSAIAELDNRADAIETILAEGVVNKIETVDTNGTGAKNFVSFTKNEAKDAKGNNVVTLTVDETSLDTEINTINEKIVDLQANAGVTNIGVKDVDADTPNLVSIKLTGTKASTLPDSAPDGWDAETNGSWAEYKANFEAKSRGDVLITLDETNLEERLDGIDTTVATEILDRKEDIANLAGTGYTAADGDTVGAWKKTDGANFDVKYRNITDLSERIAQIDANLVTTISAVDTNATADGPNWVEFTKTDAANANGDNTVTLTVNETKLGEYITKNEANLSALDGLTVNGHPVITATAGSGNYAQVTLTHTDVVLSTQDITRNTTAGVAGPKNLEEQLTEYDSKIAALASATHFRGVKNEIPTTAYEGLDYGDIIIVGNKEFIYNADPEADDYAYDTDHWVEIGDVEEEQTRIEKLEDWVDNNIIQEAEITAIFTANGAKPTFTF